MDNRVAMVKEMVRQTLCGDGWIVVSKFDADPVARFRALKIALARDLSCVSTGACHSASYDENIYHYVGAVLQLGETRSVDHKKPFYHVLL